MSEKTEEEFIEEMKETIRKTTLDVSKKVNRSAFHFMQKKGWYSLKDADVIEKFFARKIPEVISKEMSKNLNTVLGLDLKL